ncbi:MAG: class I SAM-dependent methyltransferase [Pirellulaceae bacterium]|nr:class I SAM-dependent methyltransferase [Pirellulaceae bacterium]
MVASGKARPLSRWQIAIKYVRDSYRAIRGKPPKHTTDLLYVRQGIAAAKPRLELQNNSVSEIEWQLLSKLVEESSQFPGPIIEIGVLAGRTTQRLALHKAAHQKIIAVDNFCWNPWGLSPDEQWTLVTHALNYLIATKHIEVQRIDKNEFFETYNGPSPSLVFLDAMHDYEETKKDILWARRVGASIICGHDYATDFPGVLQIVDELGGPFQLSGSVWRLAS